MLYWSILRGKKAENLLLYQFDEIDETFLINWLTIFIAAMNYVKDITTLSQGMK